MVRMDSVLSVNPEDFDCTVQPGVSRKTLNNYLRDTGLWFPVGEYIIFDWLLRVRVLENTSNTQIVRV